MNGIKYARVLRGMSVKDLSNALNVSTTTIYAWEKRMTGISCSNMVKLTDFFAVDREFLAQRYKTIKTQELCK